MNVLELGRNENSELANIRPKPILSGLPASLIELVHSHFYGKSRLYFDQREGRDDEPIFRPTFEQPLHVISTRFTVVELGERSCVDKANLQKRSRRNSMTVSDREPSIDERARLTSSRVTLSVLARSHSSAEKYREGSELIADSSTIVTMSREWSGKASASVGFNTPSS
ncbi:MAG: hypothetical protein ABSF22_03890 [Bryobacteraceae bacterium]